jgi:hypothetical protein
MSTQHVSLFTDEEHVILAEWLSFEPVEPVDPVDSDLTIDSILEAYGFNRGGGHYSDLSAATAAVVLERVQDELPQWGSVRYDADGNPQVTLGREIRERSASRTVELTPRHLFTINWADSGPGFSWPVAYYVTWIPAYDRYIVTASADSIDAHGYCDFALGQFGPDEDVAAASADIIEADWSDQHGCYDQHRWAYLFGTGLISEAEAEEIADRVWP